MTLCVECYVRRGGKTLMLHRNKKDGDVNKGKWIGLGGKFLPDESPEECLLREVKEESGLTLTSYRLRGIVTFMTKNGRAVTGEPFLIFIYTADGFEGELTQCDEGTLEWVEDDKLQDLELWEGDRLFWRWIDEDKYFFSAKFVYEVDSLIENEVAFY